VGGGGGVENTRETGDKCWPDEQSHMF